MSTNSEETGQVSEKTKKRVPDRKEHLSSSPELELYQRESDPASHLVRSRLSQLSLDYVLRNIPLGDALKNERLAQAGGKVEIPFMIDHRTGTKLYGAGPILEYLDHQYGESEHTPTLRFAERINKQVESSAEQLTWAVKGPIEQLQKIRGETREAVKIFGRSVHTLKEAWNRSKHD